MGNGFLVRSSWFLVRRGWGGRLWAVSGVVMKWLYYQENRIAEWALVKLVMPGSFKFAIFV